MPRDCIEIAADIGDIHRPVHRRLTAIDEDRHTTVARGVADRLNRDPCAKHVRHLRYRDQPGLRADGVDHLLGIEAAIDLWLDPFQHDPLSFAQEMPGNDVGMVFHHAQHDLVPGPKPRRRPGVGHKVDAVRRAGGKDHLARIGGAKEPRDDPPHRFIPVGRKIGKVMQAPVNIGIFIRIPTDDRVDHHLGFLRRSPIVQIDQRLAVHLAPEDREIQPDLFDIIHRLSSPPLESASSRRTQRKPPRPAPPAAMRQEPPETPAAGL